MFRISSIAIFLVGFLFQQTLGSPPNVTICNAGDVGCVLSSSSQVIAHYFNGYSALGLTTINPITIPTMSVSIPPLGLASGSGTFTNVNIYGLKYFNASSATGFGSNPVGTHTITFKGPYLLAAGNYTASGATALLPISGKGLAVVSFDDPTFTISIGATSSIVNGQTYLKVNTLSCTFVPSESGSYYFGNLATSPYVQSTGTASVNIFETALSVATVSMLQNSICQQLKPNIGNVFNTWPYSQLIH